MKDRVRFWWTTNIKLGNRIGGFDVDNFLETSQTKYTLFVSWQVNE